MSNRKNKRRHYGLYATSWFLGFKAHCRGLRHERGYQVFMQWCRSPKGRKAVPRRESYDIHV